MNVIYENVPYFELDGKKHYIRRNRYLQAVLDKSRDESKLSEEDELELAREQELKQKIERLSERKKELEDKYFETFSSEDEEIYNRACAVYDSLLEAYSKTKGLIAQRQNETIKIGESLIIKSLQIDNEGKEVMTEEEAKRLWEDYVAKAGQITAIQFVILTANYLIGNDGEEENPFIAQTKARLEQKANSNKSKKGIR